MNARSASVDSPARQTSARAEHISIESAPDVVDTPLRHPHRRTVATFRLASSLRRAQTEVALLDDHYLSVRTQHAGEPASKYVLDLRFANPRPVIVRHIAWYCLAVCAALLLAAIGLVWWAFAAAAPWIHPGLFGGAGCLLVSAAALFMCLKRTTESLQFTSVHGGATLVNIVGGIGSAKAGRRFFVEVIKSISAAKVVRTQPKPQFLRDEMREHHRLHELHVLSDAEYEASKARILASHS